MPYERPVESNVTAGIKLDHGDRIMCLNNSMGIRIFAEGGLVQFHLDDTELFEIHEYLKDYFASKSAEILSADTPDHTGDL